MKCPKCKKPVPRKGYCPKCKAGYNQLWYLANKDEQLARVKKNNKKYRDGIRRLLDRLKSVPCGDCHKAYPPWIMDFDHRPGEKKCFNLASAATFNMNIELVLAETKKCDVVCSNCHRERTHRRRSASRMLRSAS